MTLELPNPLLSEEALKRLGQMNAELLRGDLDWVHRRREGVTILDETAIRRQVSVDFTLPRTLPGLGDLAIGETPGGVAIFAAPVLLLEKRPRVLMNFDFLSESRTTVPLMTSFDNGRVSKATLEAMASARLRQDGLDLLPDLRKVLEQIAVAPLGAALRWVARLRSPLPSDSFGEQNRLLLEDAPVRRWIETLAHSSIVMAMFEAPAIERKVVKLSYQEPISSKLPLWGLLGWAPYHVRVDSPFVSACSYHFEVTAPQELWITRAILVGDDPECRPETATGLNRRVHLYLPKAKRVGGATADLWLRVGAAGFLGGAVFASVLVAAVVFTLACFTDEIASNPIGVPALLLFFPGLFASYIARPDQHPLTSRLLSRARLLLLGSGLIAFAMAIRLIVSGRAIDPDEPRQLSARADDLAEWLYPGAAVAAAVSAVLLITWALSHPLPRRMLGYVRRRLPSLWANRFHFAASVRASPESTARYTAAGDTALAVGIAWEEDEDGWRATVEERHRGWRTRLELAIRRAPDGARLTCTGTVSPVSGLGWLAPWLLRFRARAIRRGMEELVTADIETAESPDGSVEAPSSEGR